MKHNPRNQASVEAVLRRVETLLPHHDTPAARVIRRMMEQEAGVDSLSQHDKTNRY